MQSLPDDDPQETREWLEAMASVLENEGPERAHFLIEQMIAQARLGGADMPVSATTPYINTIPLDREQRSSGSHELEHRIRALTRWNAMALILNANKESSELGGHIASFASAATWFISRDILRPASMRAPSSKAVSARNRCTGSVRKRKAEACPPIRTPG